MGEGDDQPGRGQEEPEGEQQPVEDQVGDEDRERPVPGGRFARGRSGPGLGGSRPSRPPTRGPHPGEGERGQLTPSRDGRRDRPPAPGGAGPATTSPLAAATAAATAARTGGAVRDSGGSSQASGRNARYATHRIDSYKNRA